ncbi:SPL family radical SAM protein [Geosporobacter ferrireducens]|uniref:SPL family radical SAM protein n=1 Tax=Geosporobacter ferrireducens TaxID=1424294 RepID=UPI00139AE0E4|nr:radical SAM protein [Geosporobacter ferrireducens]MTI56024.1 radical SAM protein [Geosporobacter ferrireducens]
MNRLRGERLTREIRAKAILSRVKEPKKWFGVTYNMNIYRGCEHGCIYCDSRSECYGIEDFESVQIKTNAVELLEKELRNKRKKALIGTGAMSDPYTPIEKEYEMTRKSLKVIADYGFPLHINTKSDLILRDIDLLKSINRAFLSVAVTVTTCDDMLAKKIEPFAPKPTDRLKAMRKLSDQGIYTGVLLMPVLPFLQDSWKNIETVVKRAKECGAQFIIPWFGVSLRDRQRIYFYNQLDKHFPGIKKQYEDTYGDSYGCNAKKIKELYGRFRELCREYDVVYNMEMVKNYESSDEAEQLSFF